MTSIFRPRKWLKFLILLFLLHFTVLYVFISERKLTPAPTDDLEERRRILYQIMKRRTFSTRTERVKVPMQRRYSISGYHRATVGSNSPEKNSDRIYGRLATLRQKPLASRALDPASVSYNSYFRPRSEIVNPHRFNYIVKPNNCPIGAPFLLILVFSKAGNIDKRKAIRQTWAKSENQTWAGRPISRTFGVYFLIGSSLQNKEKVDLKQEAVTHKDIIRQDFQDSYANLTLKALLALQWAAENCPGARYMMKTDDDMFINVRGLVNTLSLHGGDDYLILGFKFNGGRVMRNGRWKVSREMYPFEFYPAYFAGGGYVLSAGLVRLLHRVSYRVPVVSIEDAFITGILPTVLRHQCNVTRLHDGRFAHWLTRRQRDAMLCDVTNDRKLSMTNVRPREMTSLWHELTVRSAVCLETACKVLGRDNRITKVRMC